MSYNKWKLGGFRLVPSWTNPSRFNCSNGLEWNWNWNRLTAALSDNARAWFTMEKVGNTKTESKLKICANNAWIKQFSGFVAIN